MTRASPAGVLLGLAVLTLLSLLASVRMGAVPLGLGEIADAMRGVGDPTTVVIVRNLRLPRSLEAAMVGGALAASGATFQALLRNPLAEPYILGISGGASVGAVAVTVLGLTALPHVTVPLAAFAGALAAIGLVFLAARGVGGGLDTRVLLLAGVVIGSFFSACVMLLLTFADLEEYRTAMFWIMGSFSGASWEDAGRLALYLVPALAGLCALARPLELLSVGEETAAYLGVRVDRVKLAAYSLASLATAASVGASGVIGFVGLIVPHTVRLLWGGNLRLVLPASILAGAAFLALMDAVARVAVAPAELPIGVVTALLGVPFFVQLLRRKPA